MNTTNNILTSTEEVKQAVNAIKAAILQSQGRAARMISGTQLSLYFGVGLYVSVNSRKGTWGTGAIKAISEMLKRELPGLRGFSEESIKKMRTFSEFWSQFINRSPMATKMGIEDLQQEIECDRFSLAKWSPMANEINRDEFLGIVLCKSSNQAYAEYAVQEVVAFLNYKEGGYISVLIRMYYALMADYLSKL